MPRSKVTIIGGGNVGASCALWAGMKELGDIVVLDIPQAENMVTGRMLDLSQSSSIELFDSNIKATANYEDIRDSDVVVITAGIPRKPGMSRDDLIKTNCGIVRGCAEKVKEFAPNAVVIIVSNPLDAMVYTAWKATGFPANRIIGQAGCLDVARFKTFIAMETGFSVKDINALLLGGHGDDMVPLPRFTNISGIPVTNFMTVERLNELVERAKKGGGELVNLMGTSAYIAPASGTIQMVEAILKDQKRILPCAAMCNGEFGINGLFCGVPCVLGARGVEKIIDLQLTEEESALMKISADHVAELVQVVKTICPELA